MKKRFEFEFDDQSQQRTISFDYDEAVDERMSVLVENGMPVIYANRATLVFLAKAFIKMALCSYPAGFHVHLNQDLDAEKPEVLRVILDETE